MAQQPTNTPMPSNKNNELALLKNDVVDVVANRIAAMQNNGEIFFPENYSPENALKAAWLELQNIKDKNNIPAILSCTKDSIANSLLSMVVQGLNPIKKQCYFIPYGNQLTLQRSYLGTIYVTKSVRPEVEDIFADVVYEADEFEYAKQRGRTVIVKHIQKLANIDNTRIVCAYATALYKDGHEESLIMTMQQLKQAWKQSRNNPIDDSGKIKANTAHGRFTEEMSKKTVINRLCKTLLNTTDDSNLALETFRRTEEMIIEKNVSAEIEEKANQKILKIDAETGEVLEADYQETEIVETKEPLALDAEITFGEEERITDEIRAAEAEAYGGALF